VNSLQRGLSYPQGEPMRVRRRFLPQGKGRVSQQMVDT
jgi:hypothetical protein